MNYDKAIQAVNNGKRVTRLSWKDDYTFIFLGYNQLTGDREILIKQYIYPQYGGYEMVFKTYYPAKSCIEANDWYILDAQTQVSDNIADKAKSANNFN